MAKKPAPSLLWRDVRPLVSTEVCCALDWRNANGDLVLQRASWGTSRQANDDDLCMISVITSQDYALPTNCIDAETKEQTQNVIKNASIQLQFESAEGEFAMDLAEAVRLWLGKESTKLRLHAAGVAILREPGPTRKTPFLFDQEWVDSASFDLQISFQTTTTEAEPACEATQVQYSGDAGGIAVGPETVERPANP